MLTCDELLPTMLALIAEEEGIEEALAGGKGGDEEEEEEVATATAVATSPATEDKLCVERERSSNWETKTTLGAEE